MTYRVLLIVLIARVSWRSLKNNLQSKTYANVYEEMEAFHLQMKCTLEKSFVDIVIPVRLIQWNTFALCIHSRRYVVCISMYRLWRSSSNIENNRRKFPRMNRYLSLCIYLNKYSCHIENIA